MAPHETAADLLRRVTADLAADLAAAIFVVVDEYDVEALASIDYSATLAGRMTYSLAYLLGVQARHVVLVGPVDPRWFAALAHELPDVTVYTLASVPSPALAIGHRPGALYDWPTIERKRATWARIVADARQVDPLRVLAGAAAHTSTAPVLREVRR